MLPNFKSKALFFVSSMVVMLLLVLVPSIYIAQMGGGMTGGIGQGGMGMGTNANMSALGNGMGAMMLLSGGQPFHPDGKMLSITDAITMARQYLSTRKETDLALDEIEEYEYNFYVVVKETDSDNKAFQLIIDKWTGIVMPEPGPNMMWNAKYAGGGMSRSEMIGTSHSSGAMTVSPETAASSANSFLTARFAPARRLAVVMPPDTFYGYYNFDVNDVATGQEYGMLSVNGATGQVWYHTWHGNFIQGQEITN